MTTSRQAPAARDEPFRFFLDFAEAEGALCEPGGDASFMLVPRELGAVLGVEEELTVTADPEVAREDGAVLMVHGHPMLDRATTKVLERGDVGCSHLPWPASSPPAAGEVVERARETLQIDHGKIDTSGAPPMEVYLPVLRVGVLVTYATSLEDRFQEREEAWVDARSCHLLDARLRSWICGRAREPGRDPTRTHLVPDLPGAIETAHRLVEARARSRRAELSRQARGTRDEELSRATAYYGAALQSIAARAGAASPERREVLAAQAEVTIAERDRRLAEIDERNEARHDIRPFRLHLVGVPALTLPVLVRRGPRAYPLTLTWMLGGAGFAALSCPHCGARSELVAGRDRLGCRTCLPARPVEVASAVAIPPEGPSAQPAAPGRKPQPSGSAAAGNGTRHAGRASPTPRANGGANGRARAAAPPGRLVREQRASEQERLSRRGDKVAGAFWDAAVVGDRWPGKATVAYSPMSALSRLYGGRGPFWAIGMPPQAHPLDVYVKRTRIVAAACETSGFLETMLGPFPYALRWQVDRGDVVVGEILAHPSQAGDLVPQGSLSPAVGRQLRDPPPPRIPLDPVAEGIWKATVPSLGLSLALRCLALWWQVQGVPGTDCFEQAAMVDAVVGLVQERAGLQVPNAEQPPLWGPDDAAIEQATAHLLAIIGDPQARPW